MVRKTTVRTFPAICKGNIKREVLDMGKKGKLERNWISSDSSTKQLFKDYVKARIDKTEKIADVKNVVTEMKQLIP